MAGTTTNYSIPYPENTDPVDVAGDIQGLAENVDLLLYTELGSFIKTTDTGVVTSTMIANGTITSSNILNGTIVNDDINASAAIDQSKIANLTTDLAAKLTATNGLIVSPKESVNIVASATTASTTYNINLSTSGIWYYTTASTAASGFILNFRSSDSASLDSIMSVGQSITGVFMNTTGAVTTSYPSTIKIDTTTQTVKWISGYAPSAGNANSIDIWSFTIIKTAANTYTVLGQQSKYA